jgi:hypothetical protein
LLQNKTLFAMMTDKNNYWKTKHKLPKEKKWKPCHLACIEFLQNLVLALKKSSNNPQKNETFKITMICNTTWHHIQLTLSLGEKINFKAP